MIPANIKGRIKAAIETRLMTEPLKYGLPLRGTLKKYWKLRVGDYRIVYEIVESKVIIYKIAHRRDIYEEAGLIKRTLN
jgi:mRNA interferase RelE/StbE